jgi:hypothetical protein
MNLLKEAHFTCLCVMCDGLVEYPLCHKCGAEADQLEREWLEREWRLRQKAAAINRKEGLK